MSYLSKCSYAEEYQPEHVYVFTGPCVVTGKNYTVRLPGPGLYKYNQGALIQDAFPDLSAEDREFVISGTSPEGWKSLFGDDEITGSSNVCEFCGGNCPDEHDNACDEFLAAQ